MSGFSSDWLTSIETLLLGQNATALIQSLGQGFVRPGLMPPLVSAGHAVIVLAVYAVAFAALASLVVRTRDVA